MTRSPEAPARCLTIPANRRRASLSFRCQAASPADAPDGGSPALQVQVLSRSGALLATLPVATRDDGGSGREHRTINLDDFIGCTVTLRFLRHGAPSSPPALHVEDLTLTVQ